MASVFFQSDVGDLVVAGETKEEESGMDSRSLDVGDDIIRAADIVVL